MANNDCTQVDADDFECCLNDIAAVADTLALLAPLVTEQQGKAEHLPRLASALYVLGDYLGMRNRYLRDIGEGP